MRFAPQPALSGSLQAKDFPTTSVTIELQDGSLCRFRSSLYHREGDWIAVYTEHVGYHMFLLDTITSIRGAAKEDNDKFALL